MNRFLTYLLWSLLALVFVLASVFLPVALAKAQENRMVGNVVVIQVDEAEELHLTGPGSFTDQVEAFANADLNTRIPRNAYPAELSTEDVVDKANAFVQMFLLPFCQQYKEYGAELETMMGYASINAVLYESPSGSGKIAYWHIEYIWLYENRDVYTEESWPIYDLKVCCDTTSGSTFSIEYSFYPYIRFSDECGVQAFAEASGFGNQLGKSMPYEFQYDRFGKESYAVGWEQNLCFQLEDEEFCIMKSLYFYEEGRERMQFIPNHMIE